MIYKRYKIRVCEGVMDYIHGGGHFIEEICVPDLGLFINCKGAFFSENPNKRWEAEAEEEQVGPVVRDMVEGEIPEHLVFELQQLTSALGTVKELETKMKLFFGIQE